MKILYVTTIGGTMNFFKSFIGNLVEEGHCVDIACNNIVSEVPEFYNEIGCKIHTISTSRSPISMGNFVAIGQIKKLVEENKYDIVHCHTPLAAMCTRLACRKARKKGLKVIYTAHGFHFYKGASLKNWMIYYPIEKICSYWTDILININKEDYNFSQKKMKAKKTVYVPGVGVDLEKFSSITVDRAEKRKTLGIKDDEIAVLSVGELNDNKNHEIILRAISKLKDKNIIYIICGRGGKEGYLRELAKELDVRLILAGFRKDVAEICKACDIFAFPSKREGLPVSVMEAMAAGLPVVCSDIRGNADLIEDEKGGYLCGTEDVDGFAERIALLADDRELRNRMIMNNYRIIDSFSMEKVQEDMRKIYGLAHVKLKEEIIK